MTLAFGFIARQVSTRFVQRQARRLENFIYTPRLPENIRVRRLGLIRHGKRGVRFRLVFGFSILGCV
jgi:hypothetical protein